MSSIRRQLIVPLLLAVALALGASAFATYRIVRAQLDNVFDYHLRQIALSLRDQAFRNAIGPDLSPSDQAFDFVIQVWDSEGVRLYLSHPHTTLPAIAQFGWTNVRTPDGVWRVYATPLDDEVIQVAQPLQVREHLAVSAAVRSLLPIALLLPVLAALLWWLVGRGVAPLANIAHAVRARTPDSLAPLPEADAPEEVQPLVLALNGLLQRLGDALDMQRDFIADAAHELRTPLTALQVQVQLLEREQDAAARQQAVAELKRGLQRATHLVTQLLTLARHAPEATAAPSTAVSLAELAGLVIADHAALADAKGIDLGAAALDDALSVRGEFSALRTLLANLVANAIRYTPAGGRVDVTVRRAGADALLEVQDSGPGIPPQERERVFDRFYRGAAAADAEHGSGLGLAIVRAIAERHGARVTLDDAALGGLRVSVYFPLAARA